MAFLPNDTPSKPAKFSRAFSRDYHWADHPLLFTIRGASTHGLRSSANILVRKMYAWRGYTASLTEEEESNSNAEDFDKESRNATLVAVDNGQTIGTLTVGFDDEEPFAASAIFSEEIDELRLRGGKLCEFTSLAVQQPICSREVLASLFHTAYIYAHHLNDAIRVIIEVNPRHVSFYKTVLSFEAIGPVKINQKVNAPSVLMTLEFSRVRELLENALAGNLDAIPKRSYYPYFFPLNEEQGIIQRMLAYKNSEFPCSEIAKRSPD